MTRPILEKGDTVSWWQITGFDRRMGTMKFGTRAQAKKARGYRASTYGEPEKHIGMVTDPSGEYDVLVLDFVAREETSVTWWDLKKTN
jgi:hypothetical protein